MFDGKKAIIATTAAITIGLGGAATAQAQEYGPVTGWSNTAGTVKCDHLTVDGKHYIRCVSPEAVKAMPECSPPQELVPSFSLENGRSFASCWNQGLAAPSHPARGAWQLFQKGDIWILPTASQGFHFFSLRGYHGYAGPDAMDTAAGLGKLSSRLF